VPGVEVFLSGVDADVVVKATAESMSEHDRSAWGCDEKEGRKLGAVGSNLGGRRYVLAQPMFVANQRGRTNTPSAFSFTPVMIRLHASSIVIALSLLINHRSGTSQQLS